MTKSNPAPYPNWSTKNNPESFKPDPESLVQFNIPHPFKDMPIRTRLTHIISHWSEECPEIAEVLTVRQAHKLAGYIAPIVDKMVNEAKALNHEQ